MKRQKNKQFDRFAKRPRVKNEVTVDTMDIDGKIVIGFQNGKPVAQVAALRQETYDKPSVFLSATPTKGMKVHKTKKAAINRIPNKRVATKMSKAL